MATSVTTRLTARLRPDGDFGAPVVRIHIGLEDVADLIADLQQGLRVLDQAEPGKQAFE